MSAARWAWTGALLGGCASLVLGAPAQWLAQGVAGASAQRVQLEQSQGTVWNGSARLVLSAGSGSADNAALPGRIAWRIRPTLQGLQVLWSADCCLQRSWRWQLGWPWADAQLQVQDLDAAQPMQLPSAVLAGLGTPWNTMAPKGALQLQTQGLALQRHQGQWQLVGQAQLQAIDLSTALSTLRPLGSYQLVLQGGAQPSLQLNTLAGALRLQGKGQWVGGAMQFRGDASSAPEHQDALGNLLNIIGRREGARSLISLG